MNPDSLFSLAKSILEDRYERAAHHRFRHQSKTRP
jgi:hypothetical protein